MNAPPGTDAFNSQTTSRWSALINWLRRRWRGAPTIVLKHARATERRPRGNGYTAKVLRLGDTLNRPTGVRIVTVWHDYRCRCLKSGLPQDCQCDPRLEVGAELDR